MPEQFSGISKILITIGALFILAGILWPLLQKSGLGHLPGDLSMHKQNYSIYFPITTSIILSIILTLIIWLIQKFR